MDILVYEYIKYLSRLDTIKKPKMPRISPSAYTESEYLRAVDELMRDFDMIDDLSVSLEFYKERDGS